MTDTSAMDDRARAIQQIAAIAGEHGLSAAEIVAALENRAPHAADSPRHRLLVRALRVLGGTFLFAGLGIFIALQWDTLNAFARVGVTLLPGIAAFVLALLAVRDPRFGGAAPALFAVAAVLEPTGMLVAFDEFGSGGDWRWASVITTGTMAVQFGAAFGTLRRSTPLFFVTLFATLCWWTVLDLLDADETVIEIVLGASLLLAAAGADRIDRREVAPFWYFTGGAAFLYGLFDAVERTPLEVLFVAAAAGLVYASVVQRSRTLLVVSILAILAYTAWFTGQYFVDSIGWPLALMAFGLVLMGLSTLALRLDRAYLRKG